MGQSSSPGHADRCHARTFLNCTLKPSPAESNTGFTIPGQAWTYWDKGPGPGDSYVDSDEGRDWSHSTGRAAAANLAATARALAERPLPAP
jgi:hypothetical protein